MKVLITVTHLLGTGHLSRALALGRAFASAGHSVTLASGGMPAPQLSAQGLNLCQLPPLRSDGVNFTRLLDEHGHEADTAYRNSRITALLELLNTNAPDLLITELYPFGRRALRAEFDALLSAAHQRPTRPVILSSVRDILAPPSKPERAAQTEDKLLRLYDGVLVHGDPAVATLDQSWPVSARIKPLLHYTGYVAPAPAGPHPEATGTDDIIVSAGGGAVGLPIFAAALKAAQQRPDLSWRLLVGGGPDALARVQAMAPGANVTLSGPRPDFRQMLYHARASVSMCGYNTALDLLQAGTPAVLIPFDDGNEVEQGLRATGLSDLNGFEILRSTDLSATQLLNALDRVQTQPARPPAQDQMHGAETSVQIAQQIYEAQS